MQTFAELKNRYVIQCTLALEAAIHVGSGEASDTADSAALRQADQALIPGSSMRGALRSLLERVVVPLPLPVKVKPCVLYVERGTLAGLNLPGVECLAHDAGFPELSVEKQEQKLAGISAGAKIDQ
jgi:hypothetical protein